jgi:hypothetical protein
VAQFIAAGAKKGEGSPYTHLFKDPFSFELAHNPIIGNIFYLEAREFCIDSA